MDLTVARIGAPHGLRGEVRLDVRTDAPRTRLAVGAVLRTDPPGAGPLTVARIRQDRGAWYATFAEVADRAGAETLRGVALVAEPSGPEEDAWYPHELVGLAAVLVNGTPVGEVVGLAHAPAHDLLVLREPTGERTLVPFVRAIVPEVNVAAGRVVLDPPGGLFARSLDADEVAADAGGAPDADEVDEAGGAAGGGRGGR